MDGDERRRRAGKRGGGRRARDETGSATVWTICVLMLLSAASGWVLLRVGVQGTRHTVERAADSTALAAASAALHGLATQSGPPPCTSAASAAGRAGVELVACACTPLDCTVSVRREVHLLGPLAARIPGLGTSLTLHADSRAGPVGESS
jgi:secretion/DNA translocation related TadE-like protein